ncbi:MAG: MFS transporter [Rhizobiales bacterium]|nr:MFS transporter [Hyphomicrobiales bacterium]
MDVTATTTAARQPYGVIALIGLAHSVSHFYHLAIPVVFPLIKETLGVSFAELGLLATVFYITSGIAQFFAGMLVDRYGARLILFLGMAIVSGAVLLCGLAPNYWVFLALMPLAGIGNSVFHPADYGILNASVKESWLGRAYGVHTLGGNFGWAAAPLVVLGLSALFGWRVALVVAGLIGFVVLAILLTQADQLDDGLHERRARHKANPPTGVMAIILSPPILLCFGYFVLLAIFQVGVQNFLPTILIVDGFTLALGTTALTAFLLASSGGTIIGAVLADRTPSQERLVAGGLLVAALAIAAVAYIHSAALIVTALAVSGFALGLTLPPRDLLVRNATPRGATGRVFGFVYSGLDVGAAVAPVTIGVLLDHGETGWTLWLMSGAALLAIGTTVAIARLTPRRA